MKLDADEKEILRSVEGGEWRPVGTAKRDRRRYGHYAEATVRAVLRVQ